MAPPCLLPLDGRRWRRQYRGTRIAEERLTAGAILAVTVEGCWTERGLAGACARSAPGEPTDPDHPRPFALFSAINGVRPTPLIRTRRLSLRSRHRATFSHKGRRRGLHRRRGQSQTLKVGEGAEASLAFSPCGRRWRRQYRGAAIAEERLASGAILAVTVEGCWTERGLAGACARSAPGEPTDPNHPRRFALCQAITAFGQHPSSDSAPLAALAAPSHLLPQGEKARTAFMEN